MAVFSYFHLNIGPVLEWQKQDGIQNHSKTEQILKNIQFHSKFKKTSIVLENGLNDLFRQQIKMGKIPGGLV